MVEIKLTFATLREALEALGPVAAFSKIAIAPEKLDKALDKAIDAAVVLPSAAPVPGAVQEPKAKRGRPAKAVQEPKTEEKWEKTPADITSAELAAPVKEPKTPVPAATVAAVDGSTPTIDKVREALLAFVKKHGKDAGFALLQKYKAKLIQEVPESDRAAIIRDASLN